MPNYRVYFRGFAYVEALNEADAQDAYEGDDFAYKETEVVGVEEVDDFVVE